MISTSRRSFLKGALAAPAIVTFSSLMPLWIPKQEIVVDNDIIVFCNGVLQHPSSYTATNGIVTFKEPFTSSSYSVHVTAIDPKTRQQTMWSLT